MWYWREHGVVHAGKAQRVFLSLVVWCVFGNGSACSPEKPKDISDEDTLATVRSIATNPKGRKGAGEIPLVDPSTSGDAPNDGVAVVVPDVADPAAVFAVRRGPSESMNAIDSNTKVESTQLELVPNKATSETPVDPVPAPGDPGVTAAVPPDGTGADQTLSQRTEPSDIGELGTERTGTKATTEGRGLSPESAGTSEVFTVTPLPLVRDGLVSDVACFGFRDNGKGALVRYRRLAGTEERVGLEYVTDDPYPRRSRIVDVEQSYAPRFWRLRLETIRTQLKWMRPVGCVAAKQQGDTYYVKHGVEDVRLRVHGDELVLHRRDQPTRVVGRLQVSETSGPEVLTGVFLHPDAAVLLLTTDWSELSETPPRPRLISLTDLTQGTAQDVPAQKSVSRTNSRTNDSASGQEAKVEASAAASGSTVKSGLKPNGREPIAALRHSFEVTPVLLEEGGLVQSSDCFGFRDDGKGVLFRYQKRTGTESRIGLDYLSTTPQRLRRRLINVSRENAGAYWRERLDKIREHVGWLVLRGCVPAYEDAGVFVVRYHSEFIRVSQGNGHVVVTRGAEDSVPVRRLADGGKGRTERISGVFLHPKHASLLVVVDRYSASEFNQVPIFIELESLSDFDTRIGPQGMTDTSTKRGIENQGPNPSSSRRADSASDAQEPTITVAGPAIENSAAPVVAGPEANQIGTPLDAESDTSRVWFMGSDILDESTICIGFSPDEKEALVVLRRFQKDRQLQLVVQRLVADPAVPGHVLFSGTEEELRTEREAFKRLELQLGFQHVHSCIEGTRRTDRLWFVAYRGRPVLVEAAKEHLVLTAQSGQPRRVAPLVPGEVIAGVYQHTEKPMALVLLGVGSNSPLPHRAILVSLD